MEKRPEELEFIPENVMSNFDHEIDREVESKLRKGGFYAYYSAWDFHAEVWFDDSKFKCMVRQHHSHVDTLEAETLEEIMKEACTKFGVG